MKRGAEKQLAKDNYSDDEDVEPGQGFKKAEESVLATRKIRGLPKKFAGAGGVPSGGVAPPAAKVESAPAPKFAGFGGFGAPSSGSTPFSFAAPAAKPAAPSTTTTTSNPFSLGASTSNTSTFSPFSSNTSSTFAPSTPAVAANASTATKTFASFLGLGPPPSKAPSEPKEAKEDKASKTSDNQFEAEKQYYTALRGLNVSFLSAVSKAIESDPFLDIAQVLEKYKSLRLSAEADFDTNKLKAKNASEPAAFASPTSPPSFGKPSVAAPTAFTFGKPTESPALSGSTPIGGGFTPKVESSTTIPPKSPFSFGSPPASSGDSTVAAKSPFTFAPSSSASDSTTSAPKSNFSFGTSTSSTSSGALPFSFGNKSSNSSTTFGSSSASSNLFGKSPADEKDEKKDSFPSANTSAFGSKAGSSTPFTFGSSSTSKSTAFTGFGKPPGAGSLGNPVGFGFGSPPRTPAESDSGTPTTPSAASATTFGGFFGSISKPETDGKNSATDSEASVVPSDAEAVISDGAPPLMTVGNSQHDAEGEGEEDEVTIHEIRSKVFKLVKKQDGSSDWSDMGVGVLRLKKHKETDNRRVLLRNSSTGKITINFNVYDGMAPVVKDKVVSFMGHDNGASVPYKLRTKTVQAAGELKDALEREITFVKAKNDE